MQKILQVSDLQKAYGRNIAIAGVSFQALQSEVLALLGPNGAGKSTVVSILSTSIPADSGNVSIDGFTLGKQNKSIRKKIGVVFQKSVLDEMLTVEQNIAMRAALYGLKGKDLEKRVMETCEMTGISELMNRRYGRLSGGQQRRCDIARALVHRPALLFLDEPATGLDPEMRTSVWKAINEIRQRTGMTVLLTTHYMDEAEQADRIIIMKKGRIAEEGTPESLRRQFVNDRLLLFSDCFEPLASILAQKGIRYTIRKNHLEVSLRKTMQALSILDLCRGRYREFEVVRGSMEQAYISIVERK